MTTEENTPSLTRVGPGSKQREGKNSECKGLKVGTSLAYLRNGKEPVWLGQTRGRVEGDKFGEQAQVFYS